MSEWKQKVVDTVLELLKESILVQSFMTGAIVVTICALVWMGHDIPEEFWFLAGTISGFWFNVKKEFATRKLFEAQSRAQADAIGSLCTQVELLVSKLERKRDYDDT